MLQLTADAVLLADDISVVLMLFAFSSLFVLKFGEVLHKTATLFPFCMEVASLTLAGEQHLKRSDKRRLRELSQYEKTKDPGGWKCYVGEASSYIIFITLYWSETIKDRNVS
jgi:hypothetical protein